MDRRQTARQKPTPAVRHRTPLHIQYAEVPQLRQMILDVESVQSDRFIASADSGDVEWTLQPALNSDGFFQIGRSESKETVSTASYRLPARNASRNPSILIAATASTISGLL